MDRVKFKKGEQKKFLNTVKLLSKKSWEELSDICEIKSRTLFDWKREKFKMSHKSFIKLNKKFNINEYKPIKIISSIEEFKKRGKLGGKASFRKYGKIGTIHSKRKGGTISQLRRKQNPALYPKCIKTIKKPRKSKKLAELIGIILGDGGITNYQVCITSHRNHNIHIKYIVRLIKDLFETNPAQYFYNTERKQNICCTIVSSVELVKFLESLGLQKGNKVKHQVDVPNWIKQKLSWSKTCLRGLMDTDGCIYSHKHKSIGMTFSNHSIPLKKFVYDTLLKLNFTPKYSGHGVYLYREKEIIRYYKEIKTSNPYNTDRLKKFLKIRRDARAA